VINTSSVCGIAYILLTDPARGDGSESWLVNNMIDLTIFNDI